MSIKSRSKAWLRLFRAHTVVLEAPMAFLGAAIGLGTVFDPLVYAWLLFGVFYHLAGYGMNSYADWKKGFDKEDERKQHHPLNTGAITPKKAKYAVFGMTGLLFAYGLVLVSFSTQGIALIGLMFVAGVSYNYLGKYTKLKSIPISIAHTLVFFTPYFIYSDQVELFGILMTAAYFVHHVYQIAISGDIKDLDQDEASLLKDLGAKVVDSAQTGIEKFVASEKALVFAYGLTVLEMFLAIGSICYEGGDIYVISLGVVMGAMMLYDTDNMLKSGAFVRKQRLKHISRREFFGYTMIHTASIPIIGWKVFGVMIAAMIVYLGIVSKFIWGNWLVPEV